jgi:osmotically inducible protein OsmC
MATRNATASWRGNLKEGDGTMALGSGVWEGPFTFKSRFEPDESSGTNPEELIGAAEAGCFTMQLAATLAEGGNVPDEIRTEARVHIRQVEGNPTITQIDLITRGKVPGIDQETFKKTADETREVCIISRALAGVGDITVEATLES